MEEQNTPDPIRIIIVDDHPNTATMLARVLRKFDAPVEIITASSGEEALQKIGDLTVDILITDFMMPGMNGLKLIENLVGEQRPAHIILTTAFDTPGLSITARRLNIQDYLVKPVQPEKIRGIVDRVIAELRPKSQPTSTAPQRKFKILVVDDNPDNFRLLSTHIQNEAYDFIAACYEEDTLSKMRSERPDLVLLDINLPEMDGLHVLAAMRADADLTQIPAMIITTASAGPREVFEGLMLGADDYIIKPINWSELAACIRYKLRLKQVEDTLRKTVKELSILPNIGLALNNCHNINQLGEIMLKRVVAAFGADSGLCEIIESKRSVICWEYLAESEILRVSQDTPENILSWDLAAQLMDTRKGILIDDVLVNNRWQGVPTSQIVRSVIAVPIPGRYQMHGIIIVSHGQPSYFSYHALNILEAIAYHLSAIIDYLLISKIV